MSDYTVKAITDLSSTTDYSHSGISIPCVDESSADPKKIDVKDMLDAVPDRVKTIAQDLTDTEKAQARTNISAASQADIDDHAAQLDDIKDDISDQATELATLSSEVGDIRIYGSSSDNWLNLDESTFKKGIAGSSSGVGSFVENADGIVSDFIYVGDINGGYVTISGCTNNTLALIFLTERGYKNEYCMTAKSTAGASRTIQVPTGAKYLVVTLQNTHTYYDYTNMKLSRSSEAATEDFNKLFIGHIDHTELIGNTATTKKDIDELSDWSLSQSIFGSKTSNWLDNEHPVRGLYIKSGSGGGEFIASSEGVISRFIYVGDMQGEKIGVYSSQTVVGAMCFEANFNSSNIYNTYNCSAETFRAISVPQACNYFVLTLKTPSLERISANVYVTKNGLETIDDFEPFFMGWAGQERDFLLSASDNVSYMYKNIVEDESMRVLKKWTPLAPGKHKSTTESEAHLTIYHRCNLLFFTDSHTDWGAMSDHSYNNCKDTISFLNNSPIPFDAVLNGGDFVTIRNNDKDAFKNGVVKRYFDAIKKSKYPVIQAMGNHDFNDWNDSGSTPARAMTDADWSEVWFDYAEENYGIVRQTKASGENSTYHYYDITDKKIRVICVDVQDVDKSVADSSGMVKYNGSEAYYIRNEQLNWIANTALKNLESGWGVVFVMHQSVWLGSGEDVWYSFKTLTPAPESAIKKLFDICKAFNAQSTYSNTYTFASDSDFNINVSADYTAYSSLAEKPCIVCWLMGHEHTDAFLVKDGINLIWTAQAAATDYATGNKNVQHIVGTHTQNCFDIVNIDPLERKIRLIRYGAGEDADGGSVDRSLPDGISY